MKTYCVKKTSIFNIEINVKKHPVLQNIEIIQIHVHSKMKKTLKKTLIKSIELNCVLTIAFYDNHDYNSALHFS